MVEISTQPMKNIWLDIKNLDEIRVNRFGPFKKDFANTRMVYEYCIRQEQESRTKLYKDINTKLFSSATEGYSASDIREITNIAAKIALKNNSEINFKIMIDSINKLKSSLTDEIINEYQEYSF